MNLTFFNLHNMFVILSFV